MTLFYCPVFYEHYNNGFVTLIEGMLQVVQPQDQEGWQPRTINILHEQWTERAVEALPIDLIGKGKRGYFGLRI